jgi:hypothetical protein
MGRVWHTLGVDWILRVPSSYIEPRCRQPERGEAREGRWSWAASLSLEVLDSLAAQS